MCPYLNYHGGDCVVLQFVMTVTKSGIRLPCSQASYRC